MMWFLSIVGLFFVVTGIIIAIRTSNPGFWVVGLLLATTGLFLTAASTQGGG